jgi:hypothetical protein
MIEQRQYEGASRRAATRAYHADAVTAMADRGFVPASEQWGAFGDNHYVLVVYEYRPQDVTAAREGMVRLGYVDARGRADNVVLNVLTAVGLAFFLPLYAFNACVHVIQRGGPAQPLHVALFLPPILVVLIAVWALGRFSR